jgi:hypothetical protein
VHPVVAGITLVPLPTPESNETGFLVLLVPESPDTPHLVGTPESFRVPYRYGAQTLWMRERDLERAYGERFDRRLSDESRLAEIAERLRDQVDLSQGCWLIGAAVPTVPIPASSEPPTRDTIVKFIESALRTGLQIAASSSARSPVIRQLENAARNPRVGLRRWVAQTSPNHDPADLSDYVHVEVHHDGTVALAVRLNGWYPQPEPSKNYVPIQMVAGFCADFTALAAQSPALTGSASQMLVRVDLARTDDSAYALLTNQTVGGLTLNALSQPPWTRDVRRFVPVHSSLQPDADDIALREVAYGLYTDVLSEFGFPSGNPW